MPITPPYRPSAWSMSPVSLLASLTGHASIYPSLSTCIYLSLTVDIYLPVPTFIYLSLTVDMHLSASTYPSLSTFIYLSLTVDLITYTLCYLLKASAMRRPWMTTRSSPGTRCCRGTSPAGSHCDWCVTWWIPATRSRPLTDR